MSASLRVGCVLMAAGSATRFGENKLTACLAGQSLFSRALCASSAPVFARVCVVSQYAPLLAQARQAGHLAVCNDRPEDGLSRTIRLGTQALSDCDGILYMVADQPLLRMQTVQLLVNVWQQQPEKIVAAAHHAHRGNPCLFPACFFPELCALSGDRGGSSVIRQHEDRLLLVEVDENELFDCDTPQSLDILREKIYTSS